MWILCQITMKQNHNVERRSNNNGPVSLYTRAPSINHSMSLNDLFSFFHEPISRIWASLGVFSQRSWASSQKSNRLGPPAQTMNLEGSTTCNTKQAACCKRLQNNRCSQDNSFYWKLEFFVLCGTMDILFCQRIWDLQKCSQNWVKFAYCFILRRLIFSVNGMESFLFLKQPT